MACVTLKRPLDFDPLEALHSPNRPSAHHAKRRRCTPIKKMESREPFCNPAAGKIPALSPSALALYKQRYQQQQQQQQAGASTSSVFKETPLSPTEMADNLRDELKRMKKRRQLVPYFEASAAKQQSPIHSAPSSPEPMEPGKPAAAAAAATATAASSETGSPKASTSKAAATAAQQPISAKAIVGTKDKPVFTLKQMSIICERMCQERTDKVRQEYDQILQQKLSEQYDAFVKFIDHQIQQRFNQSQLPSYLS